MGPSSADVEAGAGGNYQDADSIHRHAAPDPGLSLEEAGLDVVVDGKNRVGGAGNC